MTRVFEARWYECEIVDADAIEKPEPDWSRVPEAKREMVRAKWLSANLPAPQRCFLWGPQIPFYLSQPRLYRVEVIE